MNVEELVKKTKITKDKESIKALIKYYEPLFCYNVSQNYNKNYNDEAKEILPSLVKYYFDNNLQDKLSGFLKKKSKTIFNYNLNFNDIIFGDNPVQIKKHYINKFYNDINKKSAEEILTDKELYNLISFEVDKMYDNYLKSKKETNVSGYFNIMIRRKVIMYEDKEKLLLSYVQKFGTTKNIKNYFYLKYMYLLKEFNFDLIENYKVYIDEILDSNKQLLHINMESQLIEKIKSFINKDKRNAEAELRKLKDGSEANVNLIKEYYSYIKDLVCDKFKEQVFVSESRLKNEIDKKYDDYFEAGINCVVNNPNISLQRYINTRLTDHIKNKKIFFTPVYVDEKLKKKEIEKNIKIINYYAVKYTGSCPKKLLTSKLNSAYYESIDEYFKKKRKTSIEDYIKNCIREEAKKISSEFNKDVNPKTYIKK